MSASKRPLDVFSATTLVAASMIGVGVYTTSGFAMAALGSPGRVIAAWVVGGAIAICGAIGYASLASRFAESGGEYMFLSRTLHPVAGLMAGWVSLLAGFTGAIAIAALGLDHYLSPLLFAEGEGPPTGALAIGAVVIAAVLNTIGVHSAARIQDFVVLLKLAMIGGFIVFALATVGTWHSTTAAAATEVGGFSVLDFASQLVWISFSYAGFNAAVYIAEEVTDAERNVPRAMIAGTVLVTLIYIVLNSIFVLAPPADAITNDDNIEQVAATAATAIGGDGFGTLVRMVIVVSLFTSVSALVMTGPRVYAKMADDGFFPRWFRFEDRPPAEAIWFQAVLAIIAIYFTSLKELLGYLSVTLSICSALTVSMLLVLRARGEIKSLPLLGIPPIIYVTATLVLAFLYGFSNPRQVFAAGITVVIGLILYPSIAGRQTIADDVGDVNEDA